MIRKALFGILLLSSLLLTAVPSMYKLRIWFSACSPYLTATAFLVWIAAVGIWIRQTATASARRHIGPGVLSIAVVSGIFILAPPRMKVFDDEPVLMNVAKSLYEHRTCAYPRISLVGAECDTARIIDKRPILFPFLVSLAHRVKGYDVRNGFAVNFICGVLTLFSFYLLLSLFFPRWLSAVGMLILSSQPVFLFWITSGGFEALNLFLAVLAFYFFGASLIAGSAAAFNALIMTLLLLAQCRYESALFFLGLPLLYGRGKKPFRITAIAAVAPVLFLPVLWQRRIFLGASDTWNAIGAYVLQVPSAHAVYSVRNFISNAPDNAYVLLGVDPNLGFSMVFSLPAILGMYLLVKSIVLRTAKAPGLSTIIVFGMAMSLLLFILYGCFYWGRFTNPAMNRMALIFLPGMAFGTVFFLHALLRAYPMIPRAVVAGFAAGTMVFCWTYGVRQKYPSLLSRQIEYHTTMRYLADNRYLKKSTLLISDAPQLYAIHDIQAVDFAFANDHKKIIREALGKDSASVLVLRRFLHRTGSPAAANQIDTAFVLREECRMPLASASYLTASRISGITGE